MPRTRPNHLGSRKLVMLFFTGMLVLHGVVAWNSCKLIAKGYPDFTIFYGAGKIVREGLGHNLYDEATQYRVQQEFAAGVSIRHGALPYNHPPFEALLFLPFTYLSYVPAYLCWNALGLLLLGWLASLLRPHVVLLRGAPLFIWVLAGVAYFPIFITLLQGQDMLLFLFLLGLTFVAVQRQNDAAAGVCLAAASFRPHLVLPFLLLLLSRRRWRVLWGFVPAGIVLVLVSVAIVGWKGIISYPSYVLHIEHIMGRGSIVPSDMPNIRGLVDTVLARFSPPLSQLTTLTASAAVLLLVLGANGRRRAISNLEFSLWIITAILVSYHAFAYDLSLLVFPLLSFMDEWHTSRRSPASYACIGGPILLLLISPVQMIIWLRFGLLSLMAIPLIIWWSAAVRDLRKIQEEPA